MKRSTKILFFAIGVGLGLKGRDLWAQGIGVRHQIGPIVMGRLAHGASFEDLAAELEAGGNRAAQQLIDRLPSKRNYHLLRHVIGIERWGQSRLKVALGQPLVFDEYDHYRPERGLSWNELQDAFAATRDETLQLIEQLRVAGADDVRVIHNDLGELSRVEWLAYLRFHANFELWRMD